jgi:probable F420-dependent oxidoreductase
VTGTLGLTVPMDDESLTELPQILGALADGGFTDMWTSEGAGADAFSPLVAAAVLQPGLRLGTAIASAFVRSPTLLTMQAAALADLVSGTPDGETLVGIGSSSDVMVQQWHGVPFENPLRRVRDVVRFVRQALSGEKVSFSSPSFDISGFRLARVPARPPKLLIGALRRRMLELAGREADGAIVNWLGAADVERIKHHVLDANPGAEIAARLFVVVGEPDEVRTFARRRIAAYLNVPVYAEFHRWLGRAAMLEPMWQAWSAGDRKAALAAIPDELIDTLFLTGSPADIAAGVRDYVRAGVTSPVLAITDLTGSREAVIKEIGSAVRAG